MKIKFQHPGGNNRFFRNQSSRQIRGLSLTELSLSIMLASLFFGATFTLNDVLGQAVNTAKANNVALFVLESARNKLLLDIENSPGQIDSEAFLLPFKRRLPPGYKIELQLKNSIATFFLVPPTDKSRPPHAYIREVSLQ